MMKNNFTKCNSSRYCTWPTCCTALTLSRCKHSCNRRSRNTACVTDQLAL